MGFQGGGQRAESGVYWAVEANYTFPSWIPETLAAPTFCGVGRFHPADDVSALFTSWWPVPPPLNTAGAHSCVAVMNKENCEEAFWKLPCPPKVWENGLEKAGLGEEAEGRNNQQVELVSIPGASIYSLTGQG